MAPAAHAAGVDIVCAVGSEHASYDPPLTNAPRSTDITETENFGCTSLTTGVSSGTAAFSRTRDVSCLLVLTPPHTVTSETYAWNTGQSSTVTYVSTTAARAADGSTVVTALGSVTSGFGQGSAVTKVVVEPQPSLTACATTGLQSTNGTASLAVAPV
ncbi:hypothetical protein [Streptomyces sp. NPDC051132]|uniref:hypothetical protein n=1 Tax=unclassified Streptomyces TaxID=2593676 RepID=UPI0034300491